jgi:hypothetical protein
LEVSLQIYNGSLGSTMEPSFLRVRMPVQRRLLGLQQSWQDWLPVRRLGGERETNRLRLWDGVLTAPSGASHEAGTTEFIAVEVS